jgi:hypothetical protein
MCNAKALEGQVTGCNFTPEREYNFADPDLVECVGDRMIEYVKTVFAMPEYVNKLDSHWSWDRTISEEERAMIEKVEYTKDDLMSDLEEMSEIVNKSAKG